MTETKQNPNVEEALKHFEGLYGLDCCRSAIAIIRSELRELREKCENWEIAARVKAFDDHFPDFPEVHTLQLTREEALRWFTKGMEATEEGGRSFEQLWCEKQQDQEPDGYPCEKCGVLRTRAEGGKIFTVCDDCWDDEPLDGGEG